MEINIENVCILRGGLVSIPLFNPSGCKRVTYSVVILIFMTLEQKTKGDFLNTVENYCFKIKKMLICTIYEYIKQTCYNFFGSTDIVDIGQLLSFIYAILLFQIFYCNCKSFSL